MSKKADTSLSEQALQKFAVMRPEILLFDFSRSNSASRTVLDCALELNLSDFSATGLSKWNNHSLNC